MQDKDIIQGGTVAPRSVLPHQSCWSLPAALIKFGSSTFFYRNRAIHRVFLEASAKSGMVTVKMNGQKEIVDIRIKPEVFASKNQEMLHDLIRAAVNEASPCR
jgi:cyclophilin family peptidyl-prolyl cis-trans isomerase